MKSRFLLLLLILCFAKDNFSQQYQSFPTDNATWREMSASWFLPYLDQEDYIHYFQGDTVISGKTFHKIYKTNYYSEYLIDPINPPSLISGPHLLDSNLYIGALREDGLKHIYFFPDTASSEKLLYDFNLTIGDTLPPKINNSNVSINEIVSIDSILVGSNYHKRYNIGATGSTPTIYGAIIEGIGSTFGLLEMPYPVFESSSTLQCFTHNGTLLYTDGVSLTCALPTGIREPAENKILTVFPNPCDGQFTIRLTFIEKVQVEIVNIIGKSVYSSVLTASEGNINLGDISNGIYFLRATFKNDVISGQKIIIQK